MISQANYERALDERERQREAGVPEEDLPPLPDVPATESAEAPDQTDASEAVSRPASESEIANLLDDRNQESA